jgi:hypothetical protein
MCVCVMGDGEGRTGMAVQALRGVGVKLFLDVDWEGEDGWYVVWMDMLGCVHVAWVESNCSHRCCQIHPLGGADKNDCRVMRRQSEYFFEEDD